MSESGEAMVVSCGSCGSRIRVRGDAEGRKGKCPRCGVRIQIELPASAAATSSAAELTETRQDVSIDPRPGTFVFFAADGKSPQIRNVPAKSQAGEKRAARWQWKPSAWVVAMAALVVGAIACHLVERFGGAQLWVVKRSVAAWMVGMMSAAGLIVSCGRRSPSVRAVALAVSAAAVVGAKCLNWPMIAWGPVDPLLIALAFAGATCAFILAEERVTRV